MPLRSTEQVDQAEAQQVAAAETPLYELLQVAPTAEPAVIRAAYHALAQTYHPDRNRDPAAAEVMRALNHAHEILSDPRRRSMYDLKLRSAQRLHGAAAAHGVRRQTDCWRCHEPIDPLVPYCGVCHWLACPKCRACGCEHPEWRRQHEPPPRPGLILGWGLAVIFALFTGVLLVRHSVPSTVQQAPAPPPSQPAVESPGPAPLSQLAASSPSPAPPSSATGSGAPIALAASTRVVEPTVTTQQVAVVATSSPSPIPTVAPTPSSPTAHPTVVPHIALVATQGLGARLRAESNLGAAIVEVLADGTRLTELGTPVDDPDRTWQQVLAPSGNEGWVDTRLLAPVEAIESDTPTMLPPD